MNEQEALEYARKIMICATCTHLRDYSDFFGRTPCKIIDKRFQAYDGDVIWTNFSRSEYDDKTFGCVHWLAKEEGK